MPPADTANCAHDTSSSGATVFVEPMGVVEANNQVKVLQSQEQAEIERILAELSAETGNFSSGTISGYQAAVELNLIFAKANMGYKMKASMTKPSAQRVYDYFHTNGENTERS